MTTKKILAFLLTAGLMTATMASPTVIPFRLVRNLILVQTKVDGIAGNFIFDSGIPYTMLNSVYFKNIKGSGIECGAFQDINRSAKPCRSAFVQIQLDKNAVSAYAVIVDLEALEKGKRLNVHGIFSLGAFKNYEVTIDYFDNEIRLYDLDNKGNRLGEGPESQHIPSEVFDLQYKKHLPYISARINGRELKLGIDTGVELNILSLNTLESEIGRSAVVTGDKVFMGLGGETTQVPHGWIEDMTVGDWELPGLETLFLSTDALKKLPGLDLDGLLGQAFLRHFRVAFNFKKKKLYLWNEELKQHPEVVLHGNQ